jgi:hypothetical protein
LGGMEWKGRRFAGRRPFRLYGSVLPTDHYHSVVLR